VNRSRYGLRDRLCPQLDVGTDRSGAGRGPVVGTVGATLVSVGLVTAVSLVLGYVYERTDNLVVPAAVHGFYNATLLVVAYVSLVGTA
jgi:membrane protease YdiL (CAAX protease family)